MADASKLPVLVTGATGFTGGHLARRLRAEGHPVELVEGDLRNRADVARAAAGVDRIYHIAAVFRTAGHSDSFYWDVNHKGTLNVLEAAAKHRVARTTDTPFNPGDIYQETKLAGERARSRSPWSTWTLPMREPPEGPAKTQQTSGVAATARDRVWTLPMRSGPGRPWKPPFRRETTFQEDPRTDPGTSLDSTR